MRFTLCSIILFSPIYLFAQFGPGKQVYNSGGWDVPQIIETSDLDNDGDIDVLIKEYGNPLFWLSNDNGGNFSSKTELPSSEMDDITSLKAFDYNNDGDQDVVAAFADINQIYLWKNNSNGSFASPVLIGSNLSEIHAITVVDHDKDGKLDILVSIEYDYAVWLRNDLSLDQWIKMPLNEIGQFSDYMDIIDMDGDGDLDYLSISDNNSQGITLNGNSISTYSIRNARFVKGVDLDQDGDMDVVAAVNYYSDGIIWLENDGGSFTGHILENSSEEYDAITIFDFDNDGDEDIFASCGYGCGTNMYENLGAGNFKYVVLFGSGAVEEQTLLHADFNGDKIPDLVKINGSSHTTNWFPNNATQFTGIKSDFVTRGQCLTAPVLFRHAARGKDIQSWQWSFGDGSTSNQKNPTHQYATAGTFTVSLKVTNTLGQSDEISKQVMIETTLPFADKEYPMCDFELEVTLDPAFSYRWYSSPEESSYWKEGNTMDFYTFSSQVFYIKRTEIATGCTSATFEKLTGKYYGYPLAPDATGAISYNGPTSLTLQATSAENETIEWYTDATAQNIISTGNTLTEHFNNTTAYFARAINAGGCPGPIVPVTANVFSDEVRQPSFVWADAGKSDQWTEATSVTFDANGKPVVYGLWTGGRVIAGDDTLTTTNGSNFLIKYNENGEALNAIKLTSGEEFFDCYYQTVLFDKSNNIFLHTYLRKDRTIGDKLITVPDPNQVYSVIAKLSPTGKLLWHQLFQASSVTIKLDAMGDLHAAMIYQGEVSFEGGPVLVPAPNQSGYCLFKYSNAGAFKYVIETGKSFYDQEIAVDKSGNTYWIANFESSITISDTTITDPYYGVIIAKYNSEGSLLWVKKASENLNMPSVIDLEIDNDGNVIILGSFLTFDALKIGEVFGTPIGTGDGKYVAKINPNGATLWVKRFLCPNQLELEDLSVSVDNNIFVVGFYSNKLVFDGYSLIQEGGNPFSKPRSFIAKLDSNGNTHWAKDTDQHGLISCDADPFGNLYVAGAFVSETNLGDIHLISNSNLPPPVANYNMVLAKIGFAFGADFYYSSACKGAEVTFKDTSTPGEGNTITSWLWNFGDGITSNEQNPKHIFAEAGTYSVDVTIMNQLGATTTTHKNVLISNDLAPQVELTTEGAFCMNNFVNYHAEISGQGSSYSIQWFADNQLLPQYSNKTDISVQVKAEQEMKILVESLDNCPNSNRSAADSLLQLASPLPAPPALHSIGNLILVEGDFSGYTWYKDNLPLDEHNSTFEAKADGNYRVEVTNEFGCSTFSGDLPLTVTDAENSNEQKVHLYPNPFINEVFINTSLPIERVAITDLQGRVLYSANGPVDKLSTKEFNEGLYIVQLSYQGKIIRKILIKVR